MANKKHQKPLTAKGPLNEAIERFALPDPQEIPDVIREEAAGGLNLRGSPVRQDSGNICLNDLWERAGKPENQRARDWHRSKRAQALENALQARIVEKFHKPQKDVDGSTYYSVGRGGGALTFALVSHGFAGQRANGEARERLSIHHHLYRLLPHHHHHPSPPPLLPFFILLPISNWIPPLIHH